MQNMDVGDIVKDRRDAKRYIFSAFITTKREAHLLDIDTQDVLIASWATMLNYFENANPVVRMSER